MEINKISDEQKIALEKSKMNNFLFLIIFAVPIMFIIYKINALLFSLISNWYEMKQMDKIEKECFVS